MTIITTVVKTELYWDKNIYNISNIKKVRKYVSIFYRTGI